MKRKIKTQHIGRASVALRLVDKRTDDYASQVCMCGFAVRCWKLIDIR